MHNFGNHLTIAHARKIYFKYSGFKEDAYENNSAKYPFGPFQIQLPNFGQMELHDIHHILTEYETQWLGEFKLAAWELGSGGSRKLGSWFFILLGPFWGLCFRPKEISQAFFRGRRSFNLFQYNAKDFRKFDDFLVGDLRKQLNIDPPHQRFSGEPMDYLILACYMIIPCLAHLILLIFLWQVFY